MKAALREKSTEGFSDMSFDELIMVNGGSSEIGYSLGGHSVVSSTNNSIGSTGNQQPMSNKEIANNLIGFTGALLTVAAVVGPVPAVAGVAVLAAGVATK